MSKIEGNTNSKSVPCHNRDAFLLDVEGELNRIWRYGHRATFLLIEINNYNGITGDYEKILFDEIRKELRTCDRLYFMGEKLFSAILPDTHEGGGEYAALRLKREIVRIAKDKGEDISLNIGLVSTGPEQVSSLKSILSALEKDLERDRQCQMFLSRAGGASLTRETRVLFVSENLKEIKIIRKNLEPVCRIVYFNENIGGLSFDDGIEKCVIILEEGKSSLDILKNIQKNHRLKYIFKILLGDSANPDKYDLVVPREYDPGFLCYAVLRAFSQEQPEKTSKQARKYIDTLTAISAATHQLNQPLQIILGKMELMLLDLDSGHLEPAELKNVLAEIRKHVLLSADINQKINRLTKV